MRAIYRGKPIRVSALLVTERFLSHTTRKGKCLLWKGYKDDDGYGRFSIDGKQYLAHRVSYALKNGGKLRGGCDVHHSCRHRACVEGEHLEAVSRSCHIIKERAAKKEYIPF